MVLDLLLILALGTLLTACALPDSPRADGRRWRQDRERSRAPRGRATRQGSHHGPVIRRLDGAQRVSDDEWHALVAQLRDLDDLDID